MAGIFKTRQSPLSGAALTDVNTIYVCSVVGSDSNIGLIAAPVATITRATALITATRKHILIRGKISGNLSYTFAVGVEMEFIGDDDSAFLEGIITINPPNNSGQICSFSNLKILTLSFGSAYTLSNTIVIKNCVINTLSNTSAGWTGTSTITNTIVMDFAVRRQPNGYCTNLTINNFNNFIVEVNSTMTNYIIMNRIELYNASSMLYYFKYSLLRKSVIWRFNGIDVAITYTVATGNVEVDSEQWKTDVFNSLTTYYNGLGAGTPKTFLGNILTNWTTIFDTTNKIVDDINGTPIFNKYANGVPVDYSLYIHANNPALYMSSTDSYVGSYKPNVNGIIFGAITDVDVDGTDTANVADLLIHGMNDTFYASNSGIQYRNRIRTNVMTFPRGYSFSGIQSQLNSGINGRYWWGKMQPFTTSSVPQESIEVIPYDDLTTPSAFPRYSAKLNGDTQMWYHTTGAKIGQPVLFNDLSGFFAITTDKNLTEYGTYAVTNADYETFLLSSKAGVSLTNIAIKYLKFELNLNYAD